ncbi:6-bladed beta-propeller [Gracilimonas mengyeensis]|uniref:6-bladed beta-propeller protein n=1 Tax=Gracilimonas mengyeensis TaxID=1302730 RepID=A0A521B5K2_9BACT|nr:6-bladed beta-propeller [Gracilimonas mengyeensis]SMO42378.1 6-bladed beta-propeller protein [Gracilimonas mengyeensis]
MKSIKIIASFLFYFSLTISIEAQDKLNIVVEEVSVIQTDEDIFIGDPRHIIADSLIYVADHVDLTIKVFNKGGKYISKFGGRGRGPGEMLDMSVFWKTKNHLLVFDNLNAKVIKWTLEGDFLEEIFIKNSELQWPRAVENYRETNHLLVYHLPNPEDESLFHIWDENFDRRVRSFSIISLIEDNMDNSQLEKNLMKFQPGSIVIDRNGKLYYSPFLYRGIIYEYDLSSANDWNNVYKGYSVSNDVYDEVRRKKTGAAKNYDISFSLNGISYAILLKSISVGMYETKEGYLIHFISFVKNGRKLWGFEVYDENRNYLGFKNLVTKEIKGEESTLIRLFTKTIDDENRVFVVEDKGQGKREIKSYKVHINQ